MPALTKSRFGSSRSRDAEGTTTWSRSSKKRSQRLRISAVSMGGLYLRPTSLFPQQRPLGGALRIPRNAPADPAHRAGIRELESLAGGHRVDSAESCSGATSVHGGPSA